MNELQQKLLRRRNLNGEKTDLIEDSPKEEKRSHSFGSPEKNRSLSNSSTGSNELLQKLARRRNLNGEVDDRSINNSLESNIIEERQKKNESISEINQNSKIDASNDLATESFQVEKSTMSYVPNERIQYSNGENEKQATETVESKVQNDTDFPFFKQSKEREENGSSLDVKNESSFPVSQLDEESLLKDIAISSECQESVVNIEDKDNIIDQALDQANLNEEVDINTLDNQSNELDSAETNRQGSPSDSNMDDDQRAQSSEEQLNQKSQDESNRQGSPSDSNMDDDQRAQSSEEQLNQKSQEESNRQGSPSDSNMDGQTTSPRDTILESTQVPQNCLEEFKDIAKPPTSLDDLSSKSTQEQLENNARVSFDLSSVVYDPSIDPTEEDIEDFLEKVIDPKIHKLSSSRVQSKKLTEVDLSEVSQYEYKETGNTNALHYPTDAHTLGLTSNDEISSAKPDAFPIIDPFQISSPSKTPTNKVIQIDKKTAGDIYQELLNQELRGEEPNSNNKPSESGQEERKDQNLSYLLSLKADTDGYIHIHYDHFKLLLATLEERGIDLTTLSLGKSNPSQSNNKSSEKDSIKQHASEPMKSDSVVDSSMSPFSVKHRSRKRYAGLSYYENDYMDDGLFEDNEEPISKSNPPSRYQDFGDDQYLSSKDDFDIANSGSSNVNNLSDEVQSSMLNSLLNPDSEYLSKSVEGSLQKDLMRSYLGVQGGELDDVKAKRLTKQLDSFGLIDNDELDEADSSNDGKKSGNVAFSKSIKDTKKHLFDSDRTSQPNPSSQSEEEMTMKEFDFRFRRSPGLMEYKRKFINSILGPNEDTSPPILKKKLDYFFYGTIELDRRCRAFFDEMQLKMVESVEFKDLSEEMIMSARDNLELQVMNVIGEYAFKTVQDREQDLFLLRKMKILSFLTPDCLDIPKEIFDETLIGTAIQHLKEISRPRAPGDKVSHVVKCASIIFKSLSLSKTKQDTAMDEQDTSASLSHQKEASPAGADDFLPLFIWVVLHSYIPNLVSNCEYIQTFLNPFRLQGKAGYCLINLFSAIDFVKNLEASSINIDPEYFEKKVAEGEAQFST